jgi:hypothetical protein
LNAVNNLVMLGTQSQKDSSKWNRVFSYEECLEILGKDTEAYIFIAWSERIILFIYFCALLCTRATDNREC